MQNEGEDAGDRRELAPETMGKRSMIAEQSLQSVDGDLNGTRALSLASRR